MSHFVWFFGIFVACQAVEEEVVITHGANLELAFPIKALSQDDYVNFNINFRPSGLTSFANLYRAKFKNNENITNKRLV